MFDATYEFDWDDAKAASNLSKHEVRFEEAMTVFNDPLSMTRFDDEHSASEERWVTLGQANGGALLLVVHTYSAIDAQRVLIRLISARRPTKREAQQYYEG
jgi:uncharacterized DUF497 family protein